MLKLFESARRASVPILAVRTADQSATIEAIRAAEEKFPIVQWDAVRGITGVNKLGAETLKKLSIKPDDTLGFVEALAAAQQLPQACILLARNAHRQLQSAEPAACAGAVQAVANLRDVFKLNFRMIVLLAPSFTPPAEIAHDVIVIDDPLPGPEALATIITELHNSAKLPVPGAEALGRSVDAVAGLSSFEAEQVTAMSFTEGGLDLDALWERKRRSVEQTDGLSVYRGTETFDDLRGLSNVKARLGAHKTAKTPLGVVAWIDEGADVFQNVEQDTSGVKTDQQRALLVEMEQNGWRGMIFVGVPGSGKSAIARAFGREAGVPTISVDFGAMENKYVGESEANLRHAIDVIKAVGRGNAFFILTCNSLKGIRPQFMRRFRRGVFFFDLPTPAERDAIWQLYLEKYHIPAGQPRPDDDAWTGAEIRECCESAWDTGLTLAEAAKYVIPVARSRATDIDAMRREAHGRFLDASKPGAYQYAAEPEARHARGIALAKDAMPVAPLSVADIVNMRES
jgi:hypothetical protein